MIQTKVVKSRSTMALENKLNNALQELDGCEIQDIKVTGAYDGDDESYLAVIIYKN